MLMKNDKIRLIISTILVNSIVQKVGCILIFTDSTTDTRNKRIKRLPFIAAATLLGP